MKLWSLILGLSVLLTSCDDGGSSKSPETPPDQPDPGEILTEPDVFVHLFEWKWSDIAQECESVLGPAGYKGVQISPPNEHAAIDGSPWWQRYQPVSYNLDSRSGTAKELADMVSRCQAVGVEIYVDAVINHMTGSSDDRPSFGIAGTQYTHYDYDMWDYDDFHHNCQNNYGDIQDYQNEWQVRNCELGNLADLKTEEAHVQNILSDYLASLLDIGVAGFRIDAAKHMYPHDVEAIISQAKEKTMNPNEPFVFQEVIAPPHEPIKLPHYTTTGLAVTDFGFAYKLALAFQRGTLADLGSDWNYLFDGNAVVFVDNHDTQRGHGGGGPAITYKTPSDYKLATIFTLAWNYGRPKVMSSYRFFDSDSGPPAAIGGGTQDVDCQQSWVCEHRWPEMLAMIQFRKVAGKEPVTNWTSDESNFIAFSRGEKGFVAINNHPQAVTHSVETGLLAGTYCNLLDGCNADIEIDDSGMVDVELGPRSAMALIKKEQ